MAILTPDQRLRVFVSSTPEELAPERAVVREVVEGLQLRPVLFELGGRPHPPRALYRAYLEQSHIFVGLYGERYGWVAPDMEVSGLEDELRLSTSLPRLLYVKEPAPGRDGRLSAMLDELATDPTTVLRRFSDPRELADRLAEDLSARLGERFADRRSDSDTEADTGEGTVESLSDSLPAPTTSFVGRLRESAEVSALLMRDDVRLLTLAGVGGIGKTRLAVQVARALESSFDGVVFVNLASVPEADLVVPAIASALNVRIDDQESVDRKLVEALADRRTLLVLDNFEHVVEAAPAVATLLEFAPQVKVLATSRRLLRLSAEHEYQLPTLAVPALEAAPRPEEIADFEAVQLFVERARAVRPDFRLDEDDAAVVAEICRRLDGVPLAIELAAARVRLLPPVALLARLDTAMDVLAGGLADLPDRQRSLRATLDWSHSLLSTSEQRLFARLATFVGGWTLEAAEAVCANDDDERDAVLDELAVLVDNSLVTVEMSETTGDARFKMLQPVREYARAALAAVGEEAAVDRRHFDYFKGLVAEAATAMPGREQAAWLDRLEAETGNLGAAASRGLVAGRDADVVDLAWHLWIWLWLNDHITAARHWLEPILTREDRLDDERRARLHWSLGALQFEQGSFESAAPLVQRSLDEFTALGDGVGRGLGLLLVGSVAPHVGDDDRAAELLEAAGDLLVAQGDDFGAALAIATLGMHLVRVGQPERGEARLAAALAHAEAIGNAPMMGQVWLYQSFAAVSRGAVEEARELLEKLVRVSGGRTSNEVLAYGLEGLGGVALLTGDPTRAATLLGSAAGLRRRTGLTIWPDMKPVVDGLIQGARGAVGDESFEIAWSAGFALSKAAARAFALRTDARAVTPAAHQG